MAFKRVSSAITKIVLFKPDAIYILHYEQLFTKRRLHRIQCIQQNKPFIQKHY